MSADVITGVIKTDRFEMEYMTFGSGKKYFSQKGANAPKVN